MLQHHRVWLAHLHEVALVAVPRLHASQWLSERLWAPWLWAELGLQRLGLHVHVLLDAPLVRAYVDILRGRGMLQQQLHSSLNICVPDLQSVTKRFLGRRSPRAQCHGANHVLRLHVLRLDQPVVLEHQDAQHALGALHDRLVQLAQLQPVIVVPQRHSPHRLPERLGRRGHDAALGLQRLGLHVLVHLDEPLILEHLALVVLRHLGAVALVVALRPRCWLRARMTPEHLIAIFAKCDKSDAVVENEQQRRRGLCGLLPFQGSVQMETWATPGHVLRGLVVFQVLWQQLLNFSSQQS